MRLYRRRTVVAMHAEKAAEEPSPAPTGSVERTEKLKVGLAQFQSETSTAVPTNSNLTCVCHVIAPCKGTGTRVQQDAISVASCQPVAEPFH